MAWTLGIPVVLAWTLGVAAIQPAIEDDTSTDAAVESTDAGAGTDDGWNSAALETEYGEEAETAEANSSSDSAVTGSVSSNSMESDSNLEPVGAAPPPSGGGGIEPFRGRVGVGAIRTIAGLNGINVRYFVTDNFSIGGSAGVALFTYRENDPESTDPPCPDADCELEDTRTIAFMAFNLEGLYFVKLGSEAGRLPFRADFGVGGRFGVMTSANAADIEDNLDDPTELHVEIPIVFQLMFGNNFALSPELGMDFRIIPGSRADGDSNGGVYGSTLGAYGAVDGPGFGWDLTPGVGLFGGASMHYYF